MSLAVRGLPASWRAVEERHGRPPRACRWKVGDWLLRGVEGYVPQERIDLALKMLEGVGETVARSWLFDAAYVSRAFESSRRRPALSWSHHKDLAPLARDEQDRLLERCEREGWSCNQLRDHLRAEHVGWATDRRSSLSTKRASALVACGQP